MWKQRSQNLKQAAIQPWLRSADILEGNIFVLSSLFKDIYPGKKLGLGSKIWLKFKFSHYWHYWVGAPIKGPGSLSTSSERKIEKHFIYIWF